MFKFERNMDSTLNPERRSFQSFYLRGLCSHVSVSFDDTISESKGSSYWKFNSLLLKNPDICAEIINVIENTKRDFESIDPQLKWELVKYKVRCVCIKASKRLAKKKREELKF